MDCDETNALLLRLRRVVVDDLDLGSTPVYQKRTQKRHRSEWPVLWRIIDKLIEQTELKEEIS